LNSHFVPYFPYQLLNIARRYVLLLLLVLFSNGISASNNDSIVITQLLQKLEDLQIKENGIFPKGAFPSFRMYTPNKIRYKADVNPFFTGLVAFTLQHLMPDLTPSQQLQAKRIIEKAKSVYPKFKNRKYPERNTYNFWPTDTVQIYPNGGWLNLFNKPQALADDLDDTVILLLAQNVDDSIANKVHDFMQLYRNGLKKKANTIVEKYQGIEAYSTWFGDKMPIELDVCVQANALYFVQYYHMLWSSTDSATLKLITNVIRDKEYISGANHLSPQYVRPSVLLYHFSRLMALKPIPELETLKPSLVEETEKLLKDSDLFMDQVLLSTSLLRWGVQPPNLAPHKTKGLATLIEDDNFAFFINNMGSMLPNSIKDEVYKLGALRFSYHCPGYNYLLLLENLVWLQKLNSN
jgi:hypothetical protein